MLAATGRKFLRGPRGTGFLYVRRSILDSLEPPFLDQHAATWVGADRYQVREDARRFECWEASYALRIGLGAAVGYALSWGLEAIEARVTALASSLREQLQATRGVHVHDQGQRRCGIVTFTVDGVPAVAVQRHLAARGVNTTVSLAGNALLDLPRRGLPDLVRASVHYYNTDAELGRLMAALPPAR
jgi:cysteine desulfurase / selenocysteine lyase